MYQTLKYHRVTGTAPFTLKYVRTVLVHSLRSCADFQLQSMLGPCAGTWLGKLHFNSVRTARGCHQTQSSKNKNKNRNALARNKSHSLQSMKIYNESHTTCISLGMQWSPVRATSACILAVCPPTLNAGRCEPMGRKTDNPWGVSP